MRRELFEGDRVEVWRGAWVAGTVFARRIRGGVREYFVQAAGSISMQASDPTWWVRADQLR